VSKGEYADEGYEENENEDEDAHPGSCPFCKFSHPALTGEGLDWHYWKDCPMLMECDYCEQVIELSGLRQHYMEECEKFPISNSGAAKLPKEGECPLCFVEIGDTEEDWTCHLINEGCGKSTRRFGLISAPDS